VYPHDSDFDYIADATGDESWRGAGMRRYFEILENCDYLGKHADQRGHGFDGWLHTRTADPGIAFRDQKLLKLVGGAALEVDLEQGSGFLGKLNEVLFRSELLQLMGRDLNSGAPERDQTEGVFAVPMAVDGNKRNGPREFIIDTVEKGYPLTVKTNCFVTKIVLSAELDADGRRRAVRVDYRQGKHLYRADPLAKGNAGEARSVSPEREIIVSCGAFNTPQLLKLSGIGPRAELEALGIEVVIDLPGVGENLQDRYEVPIISEVSSDFSSVKKCTFGAPGDPCLAQWERGEGVYGNTGSVVTIIKRSRDHQPDPDLFVFGYFPGYAQTLTADNHHFTWLVLKGHTKNHAGYVRLRTADPFDVPEINFKYFHEGTTENGEDWDDLDAVVEAHRRSDALRLVRGSLARAGCRLELGRDARVRQGRGLGSPRIVHVQDRRGR
jgi:choline dehydrogenase